MRPVKKVLIDPIKMSKTIRIRKGYDIKLKGKAERTTVDLASPSTFALKPTDFKDLTPKLVLKAGNEVKAGEAIFVDKDNPTVKFCSPVSGEITEVRRGAKRKILEVVILADKELKYKDFGTATPSSLNRDGVANKMLESGVWPVIKQRPYGTVAKPEVAPRDIFISGFNSAPIAADIDFVIEGEENNFQTGIDALAQLTDGSVYLGLNGSSSKLAGVQNVTKNTFDGPHPAGNIGVQIHHTAPVNKGEVVWTVSAQDVVVIGRLFNSGKLDLSRKIAVAGTKVNAPKYVKTIAGANLEGLVNEHINNDNTRIISGNVLTGTHVEANGFLGFSDDSITAIPEGNHTDFLGWTLPGFGKFSLSRTFLSYLTPGKEYDLDTNLHGEERAFVVTGEYEKVFPFDILPQFLLRAIITRNIDKMEALGIYEVIEEDFALPEVICTSKIPLQEIVGEGLSYLKKEMGH